MDRPTKEQVYAKIDALLATAYGDLTLESAKVLYELLALIDALYEDRSGYVSR